MLSGLPKNLVVEDHIFQRKDEFHCTLVSLKKISAMIDADNIETVDARLVELFKDFISDKPLTDLKLTNNYSLVSDLGTHTVVVLVELSGMERYFELLRREFNVDIPSQPLHITLYTQESHPGIPINSHEQMEKIAKDIELDFEVKLDE